MSIFTIIDEFVKNERSKFQNIDNNIFAMSFGQIQRYREFIEIIYGRYQKLSDAHTENFDAFTKSLEKNGGGPMSVEQQKSYNKHMFLNTELHLEIESFYIFAKILLDKIANLMGVYFGEMPKVSYLSHNKFVKSLPAFTKTIKVKSEILINSAKQITDIVDFRDDHIVHKGSPRDTFGTTWSKNKRPQRVKVRIYPKETDNQKESGSLDELMKNTDLYIKNIIDFIEQNNDKTKLTLL